MNTREPPRCPHCGERLETLDIRGIQPAHWNGKEEKWVKEPHRIAFTDNMDRKPGIFCERCDGRLENEFLNSHGGIKGTYLKEHKYIPEPPVSTCFKDCKALLKEKLELPQTVIDRTGEIIEEFQPYLDKRLKSLWQTDVLEPPAYLKPDVLISSCLYLACQEKEASISMFRIAKVQGHYDTSAMSRAIAKIQNDVGDL